MKSFSFQLNRRGLITLLMAMLFALPAFSQKMAVQGTVIDENGEPIIGASVVDSKTKAGTATDFDGNFVLNVDKNAVLQVTYVGYKTQNVNVDGRNKLTVKLQTNSVVLNEVVAIGYGTVKKEDATGAISTLKPDEIEAGLATSAQDLLVGAAPGVVVTSNGGQPEGGATIRIRGGASLNATNDPLIVIDGVPMDTKGTLGSSNPLSFVSPENIENMTILKDASATAIYGSRATNYKERTERQTTNQLHCQRLCQHSTQLREHDDRRRVPFFHQQLLWSRVGTGTGSWHIQHKLAEGNSPHVCFT